MAAPAGLELPAGARRLGRGDLRGDAHPGDAAGAGDAGVLGPQPPVQAQAGGGGAGLRLELGSESPTVFVLFFVERRGGLRRGS